jgi:hypothetical protein
MRAARVAGLFGVLIVARLMMLAGTRIPISPWTPVAYFWQDVAVVLVFAILDYTIWREGSRWMLYAIIVAYVALNVPIARVLSSPLTLPMIRAARGPISDSIKYYLTVTNIGAITLVVCTGIVLPIGFPRLKSRRPRIVAVLIVASLAVVAAGPYAVSRVDTAGRYRNAIGALWPAHIANPGQRPEKQNWRASPFPAAPGSLDDLSRYRGAAAGRNVVMVLLESTGARYWPASRPARDPMPNLSAIAAQGISFQYAYAVYPESIKGLLSVLCSIYPAFNVPPEAYSRIACPSLAQQLGSAGYRTALFHSGRFMYLGMPAVIEKRGFDVLEDAGSIGGNIHSSFGVEDFSTVKRILSWIDSLKRGDRFFVTYLPVAGHHPYATPGPGPFASSGEDGELSRYLNALHYGDEALGELLVGLRSRNLDNNTLFVFFGDHGEAFGQHEGNFGHTLFIYDENVHVPYVIAAPGLIREQIHISGPVSLMDTAPTVLDLLGVPIPAGFEGSSMLDSQPRMPLFFTDYSLGWLGLVDGCWKYMFEINSGHSKVYDVCKDPGELNDVSGREPDRVSAYKSRLEEWVAAQRASVLLRSRQ